MIDGLLVGAVYGRQKSEREVTQSCGESLERLGLLRRANTLAGSLTSCSNCTNNPGTSPARTRCANFAATRQWAIT